MENCDIRTNLIAVSLRCQRIWEHSWFVVIVFVVGAVLRLLQLTNNGLWLDEIWSMQTSASTNSIAQIIERCQNDTHPPFFDILLHGWLTFFGDSDLSGRMLAYTIGLLGMAATWCYALRISGKRTTALVALALVSFSYFHIYYSNEVRFYGLLYLCSLMLISHVFLYAQLKKSSDLIITSVLAIVLLYTHYYGAFLLAGLALVILALRIVGEISNQQFLALCVAGSLAVLAFLPWVPSISAGNTADNWIAPPKIYDFFVYFYNYTGKNPVEFLFIIGGLVFAALQFMRNKVRSVLLFGLIVLGFMIPLIVSWAITPVLHERYTMIYFPAIVLLVSLGWSETNLLNCTRRSLILGAVWVAIAVNFTFIHSYFREETKEPWRKMAAELKDSEKAPVYTEMKFWMDYYLDQQQLPQARPLEKWGEEEVFWYVSTPYTEQAFPALKDHQYQLNRRIEYSDSFSLEQYRRIE